MSSEITDEKLMERYKSGSMKAFEELYSRHNAKVYGYLKKRVQSRFDVDEIHQNVFLKLHRSRQRYNSSLSFLPWLFTICRSVMIDFIRSTDAKESRLIQDDYILDGLPSIERETPNIDALMPAISSLSKDQRTAIKMRYGDDFDFEEIAKRLNTSAPNARQIISRALRKLKILLNSKERL